MLLGLGDGGDELGAPAGRQNLLGGLPVGVKLPVTLRAVVGGIEDGVVKEGV